MDAIWGSRDHDTRGTSKIATSDEIRGCAREDKWRPNKNELPTGVGVRQIPAKKGNETPRVSANVLKSKGRWVGRKTLERCGEEMETNEAWGDLHACADGLGHASTQVRVREHVLA